MKPQISTPQMNDEVYRDGAGFSGTWYDPVKDIADTCATITALKDGWHISTIGYKTENGKVVLIDEFKTVSGVKHD